jgi:hypothetical protein
MLWFLAITCINVSGFCSSGFYYDEEPDSAAWFQKQENCLTEATRVMKLNPAWSATCVQKTPPDYSHYVLKPLTGRPCDPRVDTPEGYVCSKEAP